ncbi:MAG: PQQ-binding-like beta-propeller repeat protein, partial [Methanoregula sp.]
MFRGNPQHTGDYSPGGTRPDNRLKWKFTTQDMVETSPAVVDGVVYFGSDDTNLYAVYTSNGTEKWHFKTSASIRSSPAVVDGMVYFGANDGKIHAIYAENAKEKWNFSVSGMMSSSPTVVGGVVYIGCADHKMYALHTSNGTEKWHYTALSSIVSSPAVANRAVYFGSDDKNVYALSADNGTQLWNFTTLGTVASSPAVSDGVVYVASTDGDVYALSAGTGTKQWNYTTQFVMKWIFSSPAVANGVIYIGDEVGWIHAINASTGTRMWRFYAGELVKSSPAFADGIVYVGSEDYKVYAINASTGAQVWNFTTGNFVGSSPVIYEGNVYVGSSDHSLYAIGNYGPDTSFSTNVTSGSVPLTIQFTDTSTGSPTIWNWSFGDGMFSTVQHPVHTYVNPGVFTISLGATNEGGSFTVVRTAYINAIATTPVANFTADVTSGWVPLAVQFTDTSDAVLPLSWNWSFGDGSFSTNQSPVHTFLNRGLYHISHSVTNISGSNSTTKAHFITAFSNAPLPDFTANITSGLIPLPVQFTDTSATVSPLTWNWSFGDGSFSTDQNPLHVFLQPGIYPVSLSISNASGRDTTKKMDYIIAVSDSIAMFRGNPEHNGVYTSEGVQPNNRLKWKFSALDSIESSPAVAVGVVYFGSDDTNLYAVYARNGTEKWHFKTSASIRSSPAVSDGVVYFGANDGKIHAIDAETAKEKWNFSVSG